MMSGKLDGLLSFPIHDADAILVDESTSTLPSPSTRSSNSRAISTVSVRLHSHRAILSLPVRTRRSCAGTGAQVKRSCGSDSRRRSTSVCRSSRATQIRVRELWVLLSMGSYACSLLVSGVLSVWKMFRSKWWPFSQRGEKWFRNSNYRN